MGRNQRRGNIPNKGGADLGDREGIGSHERSYCTVIYHLVALVIKKKKMSTSAAMGQGLGRRHSNQAL